MNGSLKEKLEFVFFMHDVNGDGEMSVAEMMTFVKQVNTQCLLCDCWFTLGGFSHTVVLLCSGT